MNASVIVQSVPLNIGETCKISSILPNVLSMKEEHTKVTFLI